MINIQNDLSSTTFNAKTVNNQTAKKCKGAISRLINKHQASQEKCDEFIKESYGSFNDAIRMAFSCEEVDMKTFKKLVRNAVNQGGMSIDYAREIIRHRKLNNAKDGWIAKILEKL